MASDEPIELRFFMGYGDSPLWDDAGPLSYEELSLSPDLQSAMEAWETVGWEAVNSDPSTYLEPEGGDDLARRVSLELGSGFVVRTDTSVFQSSEPAENPAAARGVMQRTVVGRARRADLQEWAARAELSPGAYIGYASMSPEVEHQRALSNELRGARGYRSVGALPYRTGEITLHFAIDGDDRVFGMRVPLLGYPANLPWMKTEPKNVGDWAAAVADWLGSTIRAGGLDAAHLVDRHGIQFVEFTDEGLRVRP